MKITIEFHKKQQNIPIVELLLLLLNTIKGLVFEMTITGENGIDTIHTNIK